MTAPSGLSRRGFLTGIAAAIAAASLPKFEVKRPPPLTAVRWEMLVYGTPIIYLPRKRIVMMDADA